MAFRSRKITKRTSRALGIQIPGLGVLLVILAGLVVAILAIKVSLLLAALVAFSLIIALVRPASKNKARRESHTDPANYWAERSRQIQEAHKALPDAVHSATARAANAAPEPIHAAADTDAELLLEAERLISLTGPKSPSQLARALKIPQPQAEQLLKRACKPEPPQTTRAQQSRSESIGYISTTEECSFNVVGESQYQPALRRLRNGRHMATDNDFIASIVREPSNPHDTNACAIYIEGQKVGYLPRGKAAKCSRQMEAASQTRFALRAKLYGGWGDRPSIGVFINLA